MYERREKLSVEKSDKDKKGNSKRNRDLKMSDGSDEEKERGQALCFQSFISLNSLIQQKSDKAREIVRETE